MKFGKKLSFLLIVTLSIIFTSCANNETKSKQEKIVENYAKIAQENYKDALEDAKKLASFVGRKEPIAPLKNPDSNGAKYEGLDADLLKVSQNITNKGELHHGKTECTIQIRYRRKFS